MGNDSAVSSKSLRAKIITTPGRNLIDSALRFRRLDVVKPILDIGLIALAAFWAWLVSFGQVQEPGSAAPFVLTVVIVRSAIYFALHLHRTSWFHVSRFEIFALASSALLGALMIAVILAVLPDPFTLKELVRPYLLLSTEPAFYLILLFSARITARAAAYTQGASKLHRLLIIGAGQAGRSLAFQIQEGRSDYQLVGFVDDDPTKQKRRYRGLRVLGTTHQIAYVANEHEIQEAVIAISALSPQRLREILAVCEECSIPVRILPPLEELMNGRPDVRAVREVRMEDLLPRQEIDLDRQMISNYLSNRTVLVTGGGGSIGGELCRQVLAAGASRLLVLGRGENSVFEMVQQLGELESPCEVVPVICDVRDRAALKDIFDKYRPQVVFHAAAHKHVPLMEQYPSEAVKNNVMGTLNVVELTTEVGAERLVVVSTDKAVEPTSVMGATKRITEMLTKLHAPKGGVTMVCVRFGNVLGSRGSVVPTMTRQIRLGRPITVTDANMVRYFMTIPEAVQLILQAGAIGGTGDVFVLDMGRPVRILDLAHDLIRLHGLVPDKDIPIHITGKRPGEKMYEDLLTRTETEVAQKKGPFFMAPPENVDEEQFHRQVEALIFESEQGHQDRVLNLIAEIVPESNLTLPKSKNVSAA
jgi:FlaA1/EpsC-like NDP-sugar epimerase